MKPGSTWPAWAGLALAIIAFFSFFAFFVQFPSTRDFPWVTLILLGVALASAFVGTRAAFGAARGKKIGACIAGILTLLVTGAFVFGFFFGSRLPVSKGAPQVGQKAPAFSLSDSNGKIVTMADLLSTPMAGKTPRGVLLVFYRGYW